MDERHARRVLRHAVSLHVLTPADLDQAGGVGDPVATLIELQRQSVLVPDVVDALDQLVHAQRRRDGASVPVSATLAPERDDSTRTAPDRAGATLAPERQAPASGLERRGNG